MRHYNSVFHDLLKRLPWASFEALVAAHGADKHVRRLSTKDQFVALLYGQLSGASSLREIVGGLASHSVRLYHVGARQAQRSTLADANARRPSERSMVLGRSSSDGPSDQAPAVLKPQARSCSRVARAQPRSVVATLFHE